MRYVIQRMGLTKANEATQLKSMASLKKVKTPNMLVPLLGQLTTVSVVLMASTAVFLFVEGDALSAKAGWAGISNDSGAGRDREVVGVGSDVAANDDGFFVKKSEDLDGVDGRGDPTSKLSSFDFLQGLIGCPIEFVEWWQGQEEVTVGGGSDDASTVEMKDSKKEQDEPVKPVEWWQGQVEVALGAGSDDANKAGTSDEEELLQWNGAFAAGGMDKSEEMAKKDAKGQKRRDPVSDEDDLAAAADWVDTEFELKGTVATATSTVPPNDDTDEGESLSSIEVSSEWESGSYSMAARADKPVANSSGAPAIVAGMALNPAGHQAVLAKRAALAKLEFEMPQEASVATLHFAHEETQMSEEIAAARAQTPINDFARLGETQMAEWVRLSKELAENFTPELSESEMSEAMRYFKRLEAAQMAVGTGTEAEHMPTAIEHVTFWDMEERAKKRESSLWKLHENLTPVAPMMEYSASKMHEASNESPPPASVASAYFNKREEERKLEIEQIVSEPAPAAIEYFTQKARAEVEPSEPALQAHFTGWHKWWLEKDGSKDTGISSTTFWGSLLFSSGFAVVSCYLWKNTCIASKIESLGQYGGRGSPHMTSSRKWQQKRRHADLITPLLALVASRLGSPFHLPMSEAAIIVNTFSGEENVEGMGGDRTVGDMEGYGKGFGFSNAIAIEVDLDVEVNGGLKGYDDVGAKKLELEAMPEANMKPQESTPSGLRGGTRPTMEELGMQASNLDGQNSHRLGRPTGSSSKTSTRNKYSHRKLSRHVYKELRDLVEGDPFSSIFAPHKVQNIFHSVLQGSVDDGEDVNAPHVHRRARESFKAGLNSLMDDYRSQVAFPGQNHRNLAYSGVDRVVLATIVVLLIAFPIYGLYVGTLEERDSTIWEHYLASLPNDKWWTPTSGTELQKIHPCSNLPLVSDVDYVKAPMVLAAVERIVFGFPKDGERRLSNESSFEVGGMLTFFQNLLGDNPDLPIPDVEADHTCRSENESCKFTAECCTDDDPSNGSFSCDYTNSTCKAESFVPAWGNVLSHEWPFCLVWSKKDNTGPVDMIGFAPKAPWPYFPLSGAFGGCAWYHGFSVAESTIYGYPVVYSVQFAGFGLSWASTSKMAFGTSSSTQDIAIWDGFLTRDLPEIPGIHVWLSFRGVLMGLVEATTIKTLCFGNYGSLEQLMSSNVLLLDDIFTGGVIVDQITPRVEMDFELYVGFGSNDEANKLKENIASGVGGSVAEPSGGASPCVLLSMTRLALNIPVLGALTFGTAVGGFCNVPAEEETGVRCSPSGYFINVDQRFEFESSAATGVIVSILGMAGAPSVEEIEDATDSSTSAAINTVGVFTNPDDSDVDAVILRLEFPVVSIFGVTLAGSGRPLLHIQYIPNAREIYRRRQTLLRFSRRENGSGAWSPWIPYCSQIGTECGYWAPYYPDAANKALSEQNPDPRTIKYQICEDYLINTDSSPDKLLYYNRIMAAEPLNIDHKYLITPPRGIDYIAPPKYNFPSDSRETVFIFYGAVANFGSPLLQVVEGSITVILNDGAPENLIPDADYQAALDSYQALPSDLKQENGGKFRPPNHYYFPSLSWYTDEYLPSVPDNVGPGDDAALLGYPDMNDVARWHTLMDKASYDRMGVYGRIFCEISLLQFSGIKIGFLIENYGDSTSPSVWAVAGQFEIYLLGLRYSVAASTTFDFDERDHRNLKGEEYSRALQETGLNGAAYNAAVTIMGCEPGSGCEAFTTFFANVGQAIWSGLTLIGDLIGGAIAGFLSGAVNSVGQWGQKFVGGIVAFGNAIASGLQLLFNAGDLTASLHAETIENFDESAKNVIREMSDGEWNMDDVLAVGNLLLDGATVVATSILNGVANVLSAIGAFFSAVYSSIPYVGWDELRTKHTYETHSCLSSCRATLGHEHDMASIKRQCWCTDEFECHVKETRECYYTIWASEVCSSWTDVPIEKDGNFPRYDSRTFDAACREVKMSQLAEVDRIGNSAKAEANFVNGNFQSKFNGLSSFAPSAVNRRRLSGGSSPIQVNDVTVQTFNATQGGVPVDVSVSGRYVGTQFRPESTSSSTVDTNINMALDYSAYSFDGGGRRLGSNNGEDIMRSIQRGAAEPLLSELVFEDKFMAEQPIVPSPEISFSSEAVGTSNSPYSLSCSEGNLGTSWVALLNSFEPEAVARRRSRRLSSEFIDETIVDITVKSILKDRLVDGTIPLVVTGGSAGGNDVFADAKTLLGVEGAGSFLNTDNLARRRRLAPIVLNKDNLKLTLISASPSCDGVRWEFHLTYKDTFGKLSNSISLFATIAYGGSGLDDQPPPTLLQTSCHSSPYGVDELDDDIIMRLAFGVDTFKATLSTENCPRPYWYLQPSDQIANTGEICTTNYQVVTRGWMLISGNEDCPVPIELGSGPLLTQSITLGGLINPNTQGPPTPVFSLKNVTYELPSVPYPSVATNVSDFYVNATPPAEEVCGLCSDPAKAIVFSHPDDFDYNDVGGNEVTVSVTNNIGIVATKAALAIIIDTPSTPPSASNQPTSQPSELPSISHGPSSMPSSLPSETPSESASPSSMPSGSPTTSAMPSSQPSSNPSVSHWPTSQPSSQPSSIPSANPSISSAPSSQPSANPSVSHWPTSQPSEGPSYSTRPSSLPSHQPSAMPSRQPSTSPTITPSSEPSLSHLPTSQPSSQPSSIPSANPSISSAPSSQPSANPSVSHWPTSQPSEGPSYSTRPSSLPSHQPSAMPSRQPSTSPTITPSSEPSGGPSSPPTEIKPQVDANSSGSIQVSNNMCDVFPRSGERHGAFEAMSTTIAQSIENGFTDKGITVIVDTTCICGRSADGNPCQEGERVLSEYSQILYDITLRAFCSDAGCSDGSDLADTILSQAYQSITSALSNGWFFTTLISELKRLNADASELELLDVDFSAGRFAPAIIMIFSSNWFPNFTGGTPLCKNDGSEPRWMVQSNGFVQHSMNECCAHYFGWEFDECISNSAVPGKGKSTSNFATAEFYKSIHLDRCAKNCDVDSNDAACGGLANPAEELFPNAIVCCTVQYGWMNPLLCSIRAEQSEQRTGMWFLDHNTGFCSKDCQESSDPTCADVEDLTVALQSNPEECCELSWINGDVCTAKSAMANRDGGHTDKFYVVAFEGRCRKDCEHGVSAECGGSVPHDSVALFDSASECCNELGSIQNEVCVARTYGGNSDVWFVNWITEKCVTKCDGCYPTESYPTKADCCDEKLSWIDPAHCKAN